MKEIEDIEMLHKVVDPIRRNKLTRWNNQKKWTKGYHPEEDIIVVSDTGQIGEVWEISNVKIALPKAPKNIHSRSKKKHEQYWERKPLPKPLQKIETIFEWRESTTEDFREEYTPYIMEEVNRRNEGFWFMNNGTPTWLPPKHYTYLQWASIDVGYPEFRYANLILWLFWTAAVIDPRCYGICYGKIRRSGFSIMAAWDAVDSATSKGDSRLGILSKTGADAKKMFTDKVVPMSINLPFFFKPIQDGMDRPKTEIAYRVPATRFTMNKIGKKGVDLSGYTDLNTSIDWKNTADNSYDGEKLYRLYHDESFKWEKPNDIKNNFRVTKTCLRLGKKIVGKCMMGSTCNAQDKGGRQGKELYYDSNVLKRNKNGQTKSGLYSLFIPIEFNTEGYIDRYGFPVLRTPEKPVMGSDGELIDVGVIDAWENEAEGLKDDPAELNEFYRQFPRTEEHMFRDDSKSSLYNLEKIYSQIDFNGDERFNENITRGNFEWENGIRDTRVIWVPMKNGRFEIAWIPPPELQNRVRLEAGIKYPGNDEWGAFGSDGYDIEGTVDGRGSNGSTHGLTANIVPDEIPQNLFFLRYNARPDTETFFEDNLMACVFYGFPMLSENNKPRMLYHFKKRGYRKYQLNRPDKKWSDLSETEKEIGGVPNSSEKIIQDHAAAIGSYINKYIGIREDGRFGIMPFNKTLNDWAIFNIRKRKIHDDSISSGLAIMAVNKMLYSPVMKRQVKKVSFGFSTYDQSGTQSKIRDTWQKNN